MLSMVVVAIMLGFTDIFIRRPVLATVVSLLILIAGLRSVQVLQVRQYPQSESAVIRVMTSYTGAEAELVKGFVTTPLEREIAIIQRRLPDVSERLATEIAGATAHLRTLDLLKPPGIAEALDWAAALRTIRADLLQTDAADRTLGAVLKHKEDLELVRGQGMDLLVTGGAAR